MAIKPLQQQLSDGGIACTYAKNPVEPVTTQYSLGFDNRFFLVPKPNMRCRPILDLSTINQFLKAEIQDGDPGNSMDLPSGWGVGNIHRLQGCLLPHINLSSDKELSSTF